MVRRLSSARLVERERELGTLRDLVADAAAGRPAVALVGGEAGIGKTRLMGELERAAGEAELRVLMGDCVESGGTELPYAAITSALRDIPPPVLARAWRSVPRPVRLEVQRAFPHLAVDEPPAEPPAADAYTQARLYESLFALLRALTADAALLLIVEDFHWADRSTRDFVEFLARNLRHERLAVAVTYRTDQLATDDPVSHLVSELRRMPCVVCVELERLSRSAVAAQLADILGSAAPAALVDDIFGRSGGNPFFAEELLASWQRTRTTTLPASLREALLARYRATSPAEQRLLAIAAAMRGPVDASVLGLAAEVPAAELAELLRECSEQHLFSRLPEDDRFGFRHEAVRQAIYSDLLPVQRRALHLTIARAVAASERPGRHAELAFHWKEAGRAPEALVAAVDAGLEAERAHAFGAAFDHFESALALWEDVAEPPAELAFDRFDILARAADMATHTGNYERACEICDAALGSGEPGLDPARAAGFHERRGRCESYRPDAGLTSYRAALRLMPAERHEDRARLMSEEGFALTLTKRWDEALERCRSALRLALEVQSPAAEAYARIALGVALGFAGDPEAGARELVLAHGLARAAGRDQDRLRSQLYRSELLRLQGDVGAALQLTLETEGVAEQVGMYGAFGHFMSLNAAFDLFFLGRWDEAAERIAGLADAQVEAWDWLLREQVAGQLALAQGNLDAAESHLGRALRLFRDGAPPEYAPDVYAPLAELALARGDLARAREVISEGLSRVDMRDHLHAPMLFAMAARVDGTWPAAELDQVLAPADGRQVPPIALAYQAVCRAEAARAGGAPAADLWRAAVDRWRALGAPYPAAYATWRQGEATLLAGDRRAAAQRLAAAHATARRLRATPLAREIEELAAVHRVSLDDPGRPPAVAASDPAAALGLTAREMEVLALIAQGLTNREIGDALVISQRTADVHVSRIFAKLDVHNRVSAVAAAHRAGVLAAPRAG